MRTKTIKCWGIPFGLNHPEKTQEITIQDTCKSIADFKDKCQKLGHKLTDKPYRSK